MSAGLLLQYIAIGLAVAFSAWVVVKKQFPGAVRAVRGTVAIALARTGRPEWMRWLGRRIAPSVVANDASCGGCSSGCETPAKHH